MRRGSRGVVIFYVFESVGEGGEDTTKNKEANIKNTHKNTTKTSKTSVIAKDAPITNYVLTIAA